MKSWMRASFSLKCTDIIWQSHMISPWAQSRDHTLVRLPLHHQIRGSLCARPMTLASITSTSCCTQSKTNKYEISRIMFSPLTVIAEPLYECNRMNSCYTLSWIKCALCHIRYEYNPNFLSFVKDTVFFNLLASHFIQLTDEIFIHYSCFKYRLPGAIMLFAKF